MFYFGMSFSSMVLTLAHNIKVGHNRLSLTALLDALEYHNAANFTGCIWFESGSYAYLDKDGAGYYWNFVQVPEIPKELC